MQADVMEGAWISDMLLDAETPDFAVVAPVKPLPPWRNRRMLGPSHDWRFRWRSMSRVGFGG